MVRRGAYHLWSDKEPRCWFTPSTSLLVQIRCKLRYLVSGHMSPLQLHFYMQGTLTAPWDSNTCTECGKLQASNANMQQHMRWSHTTLYGITVQVTLDLVWPWAGQPTDISETQYSFISGPHHSGWLFGGEVFQKIVQFLSCGYILMTMNFLTS